MDFREKLYPVKTKALDLLCSISSGARKFKLEENILIFAYPRSGSTWLMELIGQIPGTASLFEPLHIRNVEAFNALGFGWRQHIPENEDWPEARATFEKLFEGKYLNFWLTSREFPLKFCTADRLLIKFVRGNAMLPWLTNEFTFNNAPLFLLRHPFAVAASLMKEGSWDQEFNGYSIPDMPFNEVYLRHESFLSSLETKPEEMVATWCINNQFVLENSRHNKDWITVYYEALLLEPHKELQRIFNTWGIDMPDGILESLRKASSTAKETIFQQDLDLQLSKWKRFFQPEEISRMQRVLNYFGIDIYSESPLPHTMEQR